MAVTTLGVLAATSAVATGVGIYKSKKAADASEEAAENRAAIAKLENARTRRNQVREFSVNRGQILARAATQGGGGEGQVRASGTAGALSNISSQFRFNMNYLDEADKLNAQANNAEIKASSYQTQAGIFNAIGNSAMGFAGLYG